MNPGIIAAIVIAALIILAVLVFVALRARTSRLNRRREQAREHRHEAEVSNARAQRREAEAAEQQARAQRELATAREQAAHADADRRVAAQSEEHASRVDPDDHDDRVTGDRGGTPTTATHAAHGGAAGGPQREREPRAVAEDRRDNRAARGPNPAHRGDRPEGRGGRPEDRGDRPEGRGGRRNGLRALTARLHGGSHRRDAARRGDHDSGEPGLRPRSGDLTEDPPVQPRGRQ